MNKGVYKPEELPENAKVYLKRDMFGWRIVNPIKNENGSINWINLLVGGWRNFVFLLWIMILILLMLYGHYELTDSMRQVVDKPCAFCEDCHDHIQILNYPNISESKFMQDFKKEDYG